MSKKLLFSLFLSFVGFAQGQAQDKQLFNHLGVGLSLGTDGVGVEAALPAGRYFQVRGGYHFFPNYTYTTTVKFNTSKEDSRSQDITLKATHYLNQAKVLVDFFPFQESTFRLTTGLYFGKKAIIQAENEANALLRNGGYILLGGQPFGADQEGVARVQIRTKAVKPYVGIGFGRAVPQKHRVAVSVDLGVQLWGSPGIFGWNDDMLNQGFREVKPEDIDPNSEAADARVAIKTLNSVQIYPVISLRLNGRLF